MNVLSLKKSCVDDILRGKRKLEDKKIAREKKGICIFGTCEQLHWEGITSICIGHVSTK